jgi:hypothetical protein
MAWFISIATRCKELGEEARHEEYSRSQDHNMEYIWLFGIPSADSRAELCDFKRINKDGLKGPCTK